MSKHEVLQDSFSTCILAACSWGICTMRCQFFCRWHRVVGTVFETQLSGVTCGAAAAAAAAAPAAAADI
jgi:hypothetical protein